MAAGVTPAVRLTRLFPLWALLGCAVALALPAPLAALRPAIPWLLGVVMFGMGLTLTPADFAAALRRPAVLALGVALQFAVMPALAWALARLLGLPPALLAGLVLVGAAPGGTASNVICYLARGDVALSIALTTASTLLAIVATPLLTLLYAGQAVPVPAAAMLLTIGQIVLLPVALGVIVNHRLGPRLRPLQAAFPLLSVAAIVLIIAIVVALNAHRLAQLTALLALAVALHNGLGLASGYAVARLLRLERRTARTLAIEVGMQNSGLAVALALQHFSAVAALPGALFSIWHNLSGAALAAWWTRRGKD